VNLDFPYLISLCVSREALLSPRQRTVLRLDSLKNSRVAWNIASRLIISGNLASVSFTFTEKETVMADFLKLKLWKIMLSWYELIYILFLYNRYFYIKRNHTGFIAVRENLEKAGYFSKKSGRWTCSLKKGKLCDISKNKKIIFFSIKRRK